MAIESILTWETAKAAGLIFWPILKDLATDSAKKTVADYVKGCFGSVFSSFRADALHRALAKALGELLQLIQDELLDAGLTEAELESWVPEVKRFTRGDNVQQAVQQAFTQSDSPVDSGLFARGWLALAGAAALPDGFDWQRIAGRFTRKVRTLREQDRELREILVAQATVATAEAARRQAGLAPDFNIEAYREALYQRYADLYFDTLDTTGAFYGGTKLWNVFVPQSVRECREYYPQLLELPKEHLRRLRQRGELDDADFEAREEILEERRRGYVDQAPQPILELVDGRRIDRLVILGDPGAGKSALLRFLALRWARIEDPNLRHVQPLSILIELREYDRWTCPNGKSLVRYLHDASTWHRLNQIDLDRKLRQPGAVLILLDGLDEIFDPARREDAINDIHRFSNEYGGAQVIVTSRPIGYKPHRLTDARFRHFMLQDLEDPQITDFLTRWHETTVADVADRNFKKGRLAKALADSPAIRELAGNPLLLTMMAILNRHQELPRDRAHLYQQASRVLLHEWDTERALESHPQLRGVIGHTEKTEMLRDVAHFMQAGPKGLAGNVIAREDLERILCDYLKNRLGFQQPHAPARALLEQLRERNFILCFLGADSYAFMHRTFLEYFCASAIVHKFQIKQELTFEQLRDDVYGNHWPDETWQEVLCLIAGMIDERFAGQVIDFLLTCKDRDFNCRHVFLAARCYQEIRNPTTLQNTRAAIAVALTELVHFDLPYFHYDWEEEARWRDEIRTQAVGFLAKTQFTHDPRAFLLNLAAKDDDWTIRQAAVEELARGWKGDPAVPAWLKDRAAKDDDWAVRQAAVQELACGWKDDPTVPGWLKDRAAKDKDNVVRRAAMQELARGWKDDPAVPAMLKDRAAKDEDQAVLKAAVQELARGWKDDPAVPTWLKDRAAKDDAWPVRVAALQELARGWRDDPAVPELLKDRAAKDKDEAVRRAAVQELARGWKDDPSVSALLKDRAAKDDNGAVREAAVKELARGWKDDPAVPALLKDSAANDENEDVRLAAVEELARGWKDDSAVPTWLKVRAAEDDNEFVRQAAVHELALGWKDDPAVPAWLKDRTTKDEDEAVRRAAVQELARGWKDDPAVPALLKDRAAKDDHEFVRQVAARELVRGWKDDPAVPALLKVRAAKDGGKAVRLAAVQDLARGWKDDPAVPALLKDRAAKDVDVDVRRAAVQELARGWKEDPETLEFLGRIRSTGTV